jgi:hypothetical protein
VIEPHMPMQKQFGRPRKVQLREVVEDETKITPAANRARPHRRAATLTTLLGSSAFTPKCYSSGGRAARFS